jgi:hypothetical protein
MQRNRPPPVFQFRRTTASLVLPYSRLPSPIPREEPKPKTELPPRLLRTARCRRRSYENLKPPLPSRPFGFQSAGEAYAAWKRGAVHVSALLSWGFTMDQLDALVNE